MSLPYFPFGLKQRYRLDHAIKLSVETKHFLYHFSRSDLSFTLFSSSFSSVTSSKQQFAFKYLYLQSYLVYCHLSWHYNVYTHKQGEIWSVKYLLWVFACSICKYIHIPFLVLLFLHSKNICLDLLAYNGFPENCNLTDKL